MKKLLIKKIVKRWPDSWADQEGAIGYLIAWLLGVPASLLLIIFLLRGGN